MKDRLKGIGERNEMNQIRKYSLFLLIILFSLIFLALLFSNISHASNLTTIPDSQKSLEALNKATKIELNLKTYKSHTWNGISGTTENYMNESCLMFKVPADYKKDSASVTYNNCLDIYFENVTRIANRNVNAKVHIDKVKLGSPSSDMDQ